MKTKNLSIAAVLLSLGLVLHLVVPGIFGGMKPDFLLATMFLAIALNNSYKDCIVIAIVAGILTAVTTVFPAGQIPSVIDKVVSATTFYVTYYYILNKLNINLRMVLSIVINTLISGVVFLGSAILITGFSIPGGMGVLIGSVVIPTAIFNGIFGLFIVNIFKVYKKSNKQN